MNRKERIKKLVESGIRGIDKPWGRMTTDEKARYVRFVDKKRAKEVNVAKISDDCDRAMFLIECPRLAERYDVNKFSDFLLSFIITKIPSLLKKVNKNRFPKLEWGTILANQPQLARYCDFAPFSAVEWACLLREQPQFIDRFDPSRFTRSADWCTLLNSCPSLWRKCPFDSFTREGQVKCAAVSIPLLKRIGIDSLTEKEWRELISGVWVYDNRVGNWIARELKRLSGRLNLPR